MENTKTSTEASTNKPQEMTNGSKNEEAYSVVTEQPKAKEEEAAAGGKAIG